MIKYDQSHRAYLLDPAIGSSRAKLALDSLQLFKDDLDGLIPHKTTKAQAFGTAAHAYFLQPKLFCSLLDTGPINDKTGKAYGPDTQKFEAWRKDNPDKIVLDEDDRTVLRMMHSRMPPSIMELLADPDGQSEVSVYHNDGGLLVKCRPDHLQQKIRRINDLKTIDDMADVRRAVRQWKYWFQQEWYKRVMFRATGEKYDFQFIFAEKNPPYRWKIVRTNAEVCEESAAVVAGTIIMLRSAQTTLDYSDKSDITEEITWPDCHYEEYT